MNPMYRLSAAVAALLVVALGGPPAAAQEPGSGTPSPEICAPTEDGTDPLRLLRQVSLDIRGRIPAVDELERVRDADDPAAEAELLIEQMIGSPDFYRMVRNHHQSLLWATLGNVPNLVANSRRLTFARGANMWWVNGNARNYRGRFNLFCLDELQTEFDDEGRPVPISTFEAANCAGGTCRQEGYVNVRPFWAPETQIRVCAYDAQDLAVGNNGLTCDGNNPDPACGCGDDLRRCLPFGAAQNPIRQALAEEPLRIFEETVRAGRPYDEALTTRTTYVNGPAAHFYRYMVGSATEVTGGGVVYEAAFGDTAMPELDYDDAETWRRVERSSAHAGVLTTMAYLMRFASDRARANQFYTEFLCDPFLPSEDGLPAEEEDPPPNLRERNGCQDCHQVLEPAAAHWARWRNNSIYGFFAPDVLSFTEPAAACSSCGDGGRRCSGFCETYFVTPNNSHEDEVALYRGLPLAAKWLAPDDMSAVEVGPSALVDEPHEIEQVARCAVRNLAREFLGRELEIREQRWLEERTEGFIEGGRRFDDLVRTLVNDPKYRTIR